MGVLFKILYESVNQAWGQLAGNKLRTFLSLLGITIGIWCIIAIFSAVSSLEYNIRSSFDELGDDVIYVNKFEWGQNPKDNWFKIMRRPEPDFDDFKAIAENVRVYDNAAYSTVIGVKPVEYRSNNVEGAAIMGVTYDYDKIFEIEFEKGRYFSPSEHHYGANVAVLGHQVAETLFGDNIDPIGKRVKVMGRKYQVIGVMKKEGQDLINPTNFDEVVILSYNSAKYLANVKRRGSIMVRAAENISTEQLKDEVTIAIRRERLLKPKEEDNFALNQISILTNFFDVVFGSLKGAALFIGGFSLIVGVFSVANIMFVSVKERTNLIGIKKALGAKQYMILLEFIIESIILCALGGLIGLALVYLCAWGATAALDFEIFLSADNAIFGTSISVICGILAGFIPALQASWMDPVEAMRK